MPLIPNSFFSQFNTVMDEFLGASGVAVPCTLVYGCSWEACECSGDADPLVGGPSGTGCGLCQGKKRRPIEQTECIELTVIFNAKGDRKIPRGGESIHAETAETISVRETLPKLMRAEYAILDSCNECYRLSRFVRKGDPEPMGLREKRWILTSWERKA